jgi:predicted dehydrogenase
MSGTRRTAVEVGKMEGQGAGPVSRFSRRRFVQAGAGAALTAASWRRVGGANEQIGVGFIGYGLIGAQHLPDFKAQPDVELVGVAEAHSGRLDACAAAWGKPVTKYRDFRKLLENKDVDAVVVSTPDHWHALHTMLACAAGKDVYVEKPLTLFVREGRWMADVAKRTKRVVQVGTQQRSGAHYAQGRQFIRDGKLGKIVSVRDGWHRNIMPGFGKPPDQAPPPELDWEMFLGPAPMRPYNPNRGIYHFRWFWDTAGGQMTNLGMHEMDIVYWFLDLRGPKAVCSTGGRRFLDDNCETPDVQEAIFEYPEFSVIFSIRECSRGLDGVPPLAFYGTNGLLQVTRSTLTVTPDSAVPPVNLIPGIRGGHPVGGPKYVPLEGRPQPRTEAVRESPGFEGQLLRRHARNFLDCIKSRETPVSDLESCHRVATALHLANISLRLGRRIVWDAEKENVVGDAEAAAMLVRPYRAPWDAELRALNV